MTKPQNLTPEGNTYQVAVTVFVTTEGVDLRDAGYVAELAVHQMITGNEIIAVHTPGGDTRSVRVVGALETGTAAANGYLLLGPSPRAYRDFADRAATDTTNTEPPEPDDGEPTETLEQRFADALGALFPEALHEIASSDAYGALKYKVIHRCQDTGETPRQVLTSISPRDREFAPNANNPAAFLASRID